MRTLILAAAAAATLACSDNKDSTAPQTNTLTGTWQGSGTQGNTTADVTLNLQQSGTVVTGDGTLVIEGDPPDTFPLTIAGTFNDPNFTLTVTPVVTPPVDGATFTGTLSGNTMNGVLNGSGFPNFPVTLTRQ